MSEVWLVTIPNRGKESADTVRGISQELTRNGMSGKCEGLVFDWFSKFICCSPTVLIGGLCAIVIWADVFALNMPLFNVGTLDSLMVCAFYVVLDCWDDLDSQFFPLDQSLSDDLPKLNVVVEVSCDQNCEPQRNHKLNVLCARYQNSVRKIERQYADLGGKTQDPLRISDCKSGHTYAKCINLTLLCGTGQCGNCIHMS